MLPCQIETPYRCSLIDYRIELAFKTTFSPLVGKTFRRHKRSSPQTLAVGTDRTIRHHVSSVFVPAVVKMVITAPNDGRRHQKRAASPTAHRKSLRKIASPAGYLQCSYRGHFSASPAPRTISRTPSQGSLVDADRHWRLVAARPSTCRLSFGSADDLGENR